MRKVAKGNLLMIWIIIVSLLSLYIAFQLFLKIIGGSWVLESVIMGLIMVNITVSITTMMIVVGLKADHRFLQRQFTSLALDFKETVRNRGMQKILKGSK